MKEAYASFPPFKASKSVDGAGGDVQTITQTGWGWAEASQYTFKCGQHIPIDLSGLTVKDKLLKINNVHMARLPTYNNTFPKTQGSKTGQGGIYQITDMHLVTTSPIVQQDDIATVGAAPAQNWELQLKYAVSSFGGAGYTTNNGYSLATPGLIVGDAGNTNLPGLNLDPNMIVFCQTDVLANNVQSNEEFQQLFVPIDSSVYGMGDLAALETLHCYRFIFGTWTQTSTMGNWAGVVEAVVGPSIIQLSTQDIKIPDLERFQVMDTNFNTTNPLT